MQLAQTVHNTNNNVLLFETASGNKYMKVGYDTGVLVEPGPDNLQGWRHVNGKPRYLRFDKMIAYNGVITIQN